MDARKVQNGRVGPTKNKTIPSLPEEIIFSILVRIPAEILHNSMRYVCRQWNNVIRDPFFVKENLRLSDTGLFIQLNWPPYTAHFAKLKKRNVRFTKIDFPFPTIVSASCDGLVLFRCNTTIHVANPLTKQMVILPPAFTFPSDCSHYSLARARSTGVCKVVCTYASAWLSEVYNCTIATVGNDREWKLIDHWQYLSDSSRRIFCHSPFSTGGFLYWAHGSFSDVVALDVESEEFHEFRSPAVYEKAIDVFYALRGKSLSCMARFCLGFVWDVWVLSDCTSGEWSKLYKMDLNVWKRGFCNMINHLSSPSVTWFRPIAWANDGEVVICSVFGSKPGHCIAYDVKTGETFRFESFDNNDWCHSLCDYAHSLVSLTLATK